MKFLYLNCRVNYKIKFDAISSVTSVSQTVTKRNPEELRHPGCYLSSVHNSNGNVKRCSNRYRLCLSYHWYDISNTSLQSKHKCISTGWSLAFSNKHKCCAAWSQETTLEFHWHLHMALGRHLKIKIENLRNEKMVTAMKTPQESKTMVLSQRALQQISAPHFTENAEKMSNSRV